MEYGNKNLVINFNVDRGEANTYIQNNGGKEKNDQTTILYKAARKILEKITKEKERTLEYKMMTSNKKMAKWAESNGRNIFGWDDEVVDDYDGQYPELYVFKKRFSPENN